MVRGIEIFREHFQDHTDKYVMIGGTACEIALSEAELEFRATKDIDIVLLIEVVDSDFSDVFWDFIRKGGYENKRRRTGGKQFYRFDKPDNEAYPYMLELFSRKPDVLTIPPGCDLTPIPIEDEASSLSAILLDKDYYDLIRGGNVVQQGLPTMPAEYLIPLKAKAFLDLSILKDSGKDIDSKKIKKHRNDVFRLYQVLSLDISIQLPKTIATDMRKFLELVADTPPALKDLGINSTIDEIMNNLKKIFKLES